MPYINFVSKKSHLNGTIFFKGEFKDATKAIKEVYKKRMEDDSFDVFINRLIEEKPTMFGYANNIFNMELEINNSSESKSESCSGYLYSSSPSSSNDGVTWTAGLRQESTANYVSPFVREAAHEAAAVPEQLHNELMNIERLQNRQHLPQERDGRERDARPRFHAVAVPAHSGVINIPPSDPQRQPERGSAAFDLAGGGGGGGGGGPVGGGAGSIQVEPGNVVNNGNVNIVVVGGAEQIQQATASLRDRLSTNPQLAEDPLPAVAPEAPMIRHVPERVEINIDAIHDVTQVLSSVQSSRNALTNIQNRGTEMPVVNLPRRRGRPRRNP